MKLYLLFDASAAKHLYLEKEDFKDALAYLWSLKDGKQAFFFIPSFCVAEVLNIFAKSYHRLKLISKDTYEQITKEFIDAVHNRHTFYSYDLNRYHNLNTDKIFEKEHTLNTEFHVAGEFPQGNTTAEIEASIKRITANLVSSRYDIRKFYLSSFDILIIAMSLELQHLFGKNKVYIVTKDDRLRTIAERGNLSKVIYLLRDDVKKLKILANS